MWPNGWLDQDATWYGGRPRPGHIVLDGDQASSNRKGHSSSPHFRSLRTKACVNHGPCLLWRISGWMDQNATWYGGRPRSRQHCVRREPSSLTERGTAALPPHFSAHVHCDKIAGWMRIPLGTEIGLSSGHSVLDGDPAPPRKGTHIPNFSAHVYCGQTVAHLTTGELLL